MRGCCTGLREDCHEKTDQLPCLYQRSLAAFPDVIVVGLIRGDGLAKHKMRFRH